MTATLLPAADPAAPVIDTRAHLQSPITRSALRIQQRMLAGAREYLTGAGFAEVMPPMIGPVTDPGTRGSKQVDIDYYGHRYKLMTSAILYKQASLLTFDKIFCIAPCVRLEPIETANTSRHLAEFHQIDVECAGATRDEIRQVVQELVKYMVAKVIVELPEDFELLGRDTAVLTRLVADSFGCRTHAQAVQDLTDLGHPQNPDGEIEWSGEALLSSHSETPFFIVDYPKGSRGFYDRESTTSPGTLRNFDLIASDGYGELCSGGEREFDYARLVTRMRETGENPAKYGWYLGLAKEGIPSSAGFGIGVERITRFVAGLESAWQANAFPKLPGVVSP